MSTPKFPVTLNAHPKLPTFDMDAIAFGKNFTDHMLVADYENGEWKNVEIKPYAPIFIPEGSNKSFAQMSMEEKNKFSHRKKAVNQLFTFLRNL